MNILMEVNWSGNLLIDDCIKKAEWFEIHWVNVGQHNAMRGDEKRNGDSLSMSNDYVALL